MPKNGYFAEKLEIKNGLWIRISLSNTYRQKVTRVCYYFMNNFIFHWTMILIFILFWEVSFIWEIQLIRRNNFHKLWKSHAVGCIYLRQNVFRVWHDFQHSEWDWLNFLHFPKNINLVKLYGKNEQINPIQAVTWSFLCISM